ncbi:MAG: hypothetical protein HYX72_05260 [Acidobacteria bacterium]|nr:hypothetical protein [Acidobacteriota bacterium]
MPFVKSFLFQGLAVAALADTLLLWQMPRILQWHSQVIQTFLDWARVPWQMGREITLVPGITARLLQTSYLNYQEYPYYPWAFLGGAIAVFLIGYRLWPTPIRPLVFLLPASLAITLIYLEIVSPLVPYTPEDFCSIWYHGEAYIWLLIPWIFAVSFFTLAVPFVMKIGWLPLLISYAFLWSAVRLTLALTTFHYFGPIWMPFTYFIFGFLADFMYIVTFYSLALDRAARWLATRREIWQ